MKEYLKTYEIRLTVIGPVFIGNGKELGKKEYISLDRTHIGVLDIEKFYHFVQTKHLTRDFEAFMLENSGGDLRHWAMDHRISTSEIEKYMKYILENGDTALERGTRLQIMECTKDAYGCPYIPGSSLKGMLRTILLGSNILENAGKYQNERLKLEQGADIGKGRTKYLRQETEMIEGRYYRTLRRNEDRPMDVVNDMMAGIIIGDSIPLSMEDVILCQRIEKHVDGMEKRLNVLRECIRPGTEIEFVMTVDSSLSNLTVDQIRHAVECFAENYFVKFKSAFPNVDRPSSHDVYLGGGCGFASKTILNAFYGGRKNIDMTRKVFEKTGVPYNHKHRKDLEYGVSPHILKCTRYQGRLLEMGLCRFEIS